MQSLIALAVRRRVAVLMAVLAVAAFGVVGRRRRPFDTPILADLLAYIKGFG